jgi:hypothetical protein
MIVSPAIAQESGPVKFPKNDCDFALTFPSRPEVNTQTTDNGDQVQYATYARQDGAVELSIDIGCGPLAQARVKEFTRESLIGMIRNSVSQKNLSDVQIDYEKIERVQHVSLSGYRQLDNGRTEIQVSNLYAGPNSLFSIEMSLNDPAHPFARQAFTILQSIQRTN